MNWTDVWPTVPGYYWFYGSRHHVTHRVGLFVVRVHKAPDHLIYICDGSFLYQAEGAVGAWLPLPTPELPLGAVEPDADTRNSHDKAIEVVQWLADQKYQGQNLLHAIVCCDFASKQHLIDAVARIIEDGTVYCHSCSVAGGADRAIYHGPPVCK